VVCALFPFQSKKSCYYIRRRFPEKTGITLLLAIHRHCLELGKSLVDRAVIGILGHGSTDIDFPQREELKEATKHPHGLMLIHAHAGCWQAVMPELLSLEKPVTLLIHRDPKDNNQLYFEQNQGHQQIRIVDPRDGLASSLEITAALKRGEIVSVMGDRVFGSAKNALWEDFLGQPAIFPISPYKIAASTQAKCLVLYSAKSSKNSYKMLIRTVDTPPEKFGQSSEFYRPYLKQFIASMEEFCKDYPYQFFNFFDLWARPDEHR
jgi:predicted LPLAT superfamily acyltransferase